MIVKLTNADLGSVQINDIGKVRSPKLTREPVNLPYNQSVTIPDTEDSVASLQSGELKKQIDAGNVTVETGSFLATQGFSQSFTATNLQTVFTLTGGRTMNTARPDLIHVFQEGLLLPKTGAYTVTSSTVITLATGATTGDNVQIIVSK